MTIHLIELYQVGQACFPLCKSMFLITFLYIMYVEMVSRITHSNIFPQTGVKLTAPQFPKYFLLFLKVTLTHSISGLPFSSSYSMAYFHFHAFFQSSRTFTKQPDLLKIIRSGLRFPQQLLSYQVPAVGNLLVSPPVLPSQCCFGAQLQLIQMLHWTKFPVPPLLPSL